MVISVNEIYRIKLHDFLNFFFSNRIICGELIIVKTKLINSIKRIVTIWQEARIQFLAQSQRQEPGRKFN